MLLSVFIGSQGDRVTPVKAQNLRIEPQHTLDPVLELGPLCVLSTSQVPVKGKGHIIRGYARTLVSESRGGG